MSMGGFLSFVKKEALHILRDSRTMLIALLMPVVQILLFGFAISTEVNNINVAVVAPHPTESVRQAVERIRANDYFTFVGTIAGTQIDRTLRSGAADAVVVFAPITTGFSSTVRRVRCRNRPSRSSRTPRTPIRRRPAQPICKASYRGARPRQHPKPGCCSIPG